MVLCAGLGTRLRPLTDELPKPLVPIGDRSILAHIAASLARSGFSELILNVHHLPGEFTREVKRLRIIAHVVHEAEIRGTAGGIRGASHLLGAPPLLVWNGDIWADPPIAELLARAARAPMVLAVVPRPAGQGVVGLGAGGEVVRLRGEEFGVECSGADYIGVCALAAPALARLPERGCLIGDVALPLLRDAIPVLTVPCARPWSDAGSLESYLDANLRWLAEGVGGDGSFVGEGAEVGAGVRLTASVVGAGARLDGEGELARSVIWPGATARAPLSDAVVTSSGRVVRRQG
jgi:mannose-1-phosphate guanylyltransferase